MEGKGAKGAGATGGSLASVGLEAYATMLKGQSVADADEFQAAKLDQAATYGDLKADQTGAAMSRSLNQTLGNIEAVRAAARADPLSPTGQAILDEQEQLGTEARTTTVNSIKAQSNQQRADANYYRKAGSDALLSSEISAGAGIAKGIGSAIAGAG
jgi:hypothetical protein